MDMPVPMGESEDRLVQEAVQRNWTAFADLYERHIERVYRHVYYHVTNKDDAEDITQETFLKAWKSIDKYKNTGTPFVYWLITIANNLAADRYRKRKKMIVTEEENIKHKVELVSDPEELVEINFYSSQIRAAVLRLKGDKQKVILMHFIDGFSYTEIAQALHKSEGTIRVIQYRALVDLREIMKQG